MKIKLEPNGKTPTKADNGAAGYDLYACGDYTIYPNEVVKVSCGVSMEIPEGTVGLLAARSGLGINKRITPSNAIGIIDSSFRGVVVAALQNLSNDPFKILNGDRVAQMVFVDYNNYQFEVVEELSETSRGSGGLGSSGK
jgi:dUTP pyrophosphatase